MREHLSAAMELFNQLYKEIDEIYHVYAKKCNLSDSALWLFYSCMKAASLSLRLRSALPGTIRPRPLIRC